MKCFCNCLNLLHHCLSSPWYRLHDYLCCIGNLETPSHTLPCPQALLFGRTRFAFRFRIDFARFAWSSEPEPSTAALLVFPPYRLNRSAPGDEAVATRLCGPCHMVPVKGLRHNPQMSKQAFVTVSVAHL